MTVSPMATCSRTTTLPSLRWVRAATTKDGKTADNAVPTTWRRAAAMATLVGGGGWDGGRRGGTAEERCGREDRRVSGNRAEFSGCSAHRLLGLVRAEREVGHHNRGPSDPEHANRQPIDAAARHVAGRHCRVLLAHRAEGCRLQAQPLEPERRLSRRAPHRHHCRRPRRRWLAPFEAVPHHQRAEGT